MTTTTAARPRRLVSVKRALEYADMGRTQLYEKIHANVIRAYKRGGKTMIDLNSIDDKNEALPPFVPRKSTQN